MESINVVITSPLNINCFERITHINERIQVAGVSDLMRLESGGDLVAVEKMDEILSDADIIFGLTLPSDVVTRAPRLKWFQAYSTGIDTILSDESLKNSSVVITNMTGFHDIAIAEYVIMTMLMFVKDSTRCFHEKLEQRWEWFPIETLDSKTVGIIGYGRIGRAVCRLCKALAMKVVAVDRFDYLNDPQHCVDTPLASSRLNDLLSISDFVVICLPLTRETRGLIGEKELKAMKPNARLIAVSRGNIVDEQALIHALNEKWIAGAALDVFAKEPLHMKSPLWNLENVIFSPHNSGDIKDYDAKATDLFCQNLKRYLNGQPLLNIVDKELGF